MVKSKKSPKEKHVKTKSTRKPIVVDIIIVVAIALIVGGVLFIKNSGQKLRVGTTTYNLIVAKTTAEQAKGLGDRASLPENEGMLFVFKTEGRRCFWMKDMRFPLDIVWTDASKKVVGIAHDVEPDTYPETFCSAQPAQYVIELNAGQALAANMSYGQTVSF